MPLGYFREREGARAKEAKEMYAYALLLAYQWRPSVVSYDYAYDYA